MKSLSKNLIIISLISSSLVQADDWPTWRNDNKRSGISTENVVPNLLTEAWVFTEKTPPSPAWHGTMQRDAWNNISKAKPARAFDKAFNLIAADNKVFFASSSTSACVALDAANGTETWRAKVGGPVRIAPTFNNSKVYFGSDDGLVYCVNANTGAIIGKHRGAPDKTMIPKDHGFISRYPCRTGVLIENGKAWCGFGLLPWQDNHLKALDLNLSSVTLHNNVNADQWYSFEGPMLLSGNRLFVLQGRVSPAYFDTSNANKLGRVQGGGGTFALITPDDKIIHGPGHGNNTWAKERTHHLAENNVSGTAVTRHSRAHRLLVNGSNRYYIIDDAVSATGGVSWVKTLPDPDCLIKVGNSIFVGGKNVVVAYDAANGTEQKRFTVTGNVHALAFSNGKLFASTSVGKIYCFQ